MKLAASNEVMMVRYFQAMGFFGRRAVRSLRGRLLSAFIPLSLLAKQDAKFGCSNAHVTLLNDRFFRIMSGPITQGAITAAEGEEA